MKMTPEFRAAMDEHLRRVESLGEDHPDTLRAMMLALDLAPQELKDEMTAKARELGLIPEARGYLDDGTPMFRLEDVAERLGLSPAEAEDALREMMNERRSLGLSNAGIVTDPATIHTRQ